jgi:hypothetical protein
VSVWWLVCVVVVHGGVFKNSHRTRNLFEENSITKKCGKDCNTCEFPSRRQNLRTEGVSKIAGREESSLSNLQIPKNRALHHVSNSACKIRFLVFIFMCVLS